VAAPVLDASALLAYLRDEPGAEAVAEAIADGAVISTANLAEVLSRVADRGADPEHVLAQMREQRLIEGAIDVELVTIEDAAEIGRLRPLTKAAGLSLGDRACLALAGRLGSRALTADSAWASVDVGVEIRQIR